MFVYGFDDFDPLQLDALDTLANRCGVDVVASLPFERGRAAFKSVATLHQRLLELGAGETVLAPLDDHYAPEARAALHHVERSLFEDEADTVDAGSAIEFHSAAGQRAEIELAGARLLDLLRDGVEPGDIAVVLRRPDEYSSLLEQVFGAYDIPFSIDRSVPLGHTGLGRGLLALVQCAVDAGGVCRRPARLAAHAGPAATAGARRPARGAGAPRRNATAPRTRARPGSGSTGSSRSSTACARRAAALPSWPSWSASSSGCSSAPYRRQAAILSGPELDDPRVYVAARDALGQLRDVVEADPRTRLEPGRVLAVLRELRVHLGEPPQPDRVQVAKPEAIRARRFHAVFVCGLKEGEFPTGAVPEPFLPDEDRRAIARGQRAAPARPRGPARPRALPVLPVLLARRAAAGAVLALQRRGGQPAVAVLLRRGRA